MRSLFFGLFVIASVHLFGASDPNALVLEADRARGGHLVGLRCDIAIDSREDGRQDKYLVFLQARGRDARVDFTAPAKSKGQLVLQRDRNMWFVRPGLQKPVAISPRQRLSGQASNGDVASTDYSGDYSAKVISEEAIGGERCAVLDLVAKGKNTTYDRIRYWVSLTRKVGLKAEFFTVSGKHFKTATFEYANRIQAEGRSIPFISRMTIVDALMPEQVTVLSYRNAQVKKLNPVIFESVQ